jgi:hypothetical protein
LSRQSSELIGNADENLIEIQISFGIRPLATIIIYKDNEREVAI